MTNKREVKLAEINDISCEVRRRRWNRLGHILGREGENDCFTALGWTAEGQRTRGRPKKRVSMGWWLLRLSAKILALLRHRLIFFSYG